MNRDHTTINKLFQDLESPRVDLENQIIKAIHKRIYRALLIRRSVLAVATTLSIVAIVPAVSHLLAQLSQTGFAQYASLAFSDGAAIWTNAKDFGLLLAESLPVMSVVLVFTIVLVMTWSIRKLIQKPLSISSFAAQM